MSSCRIGITCGSGGTKRPAPSLPRRGNSSLPPTVSCKRRWDTSLQEVQITWPVNMTNELMQE